MLEDKIKQLKKIIKGLCWVSEADYPWTIEIVPELKLESKEVETVNFDKFFAIATEVKSWHSDKEQQEVKRYQDLVTWLKENVTDLAVYRQGQIEVEICVIGKINAHWLLLKTIAVET